MFDWLGNAVSSIIKFLPVLFADESSPNYALIRAMLGLSLIVFVAYLIAMRPIHSTVASCIAKMSKWIGRHP